MIAPRLSRAHRADAQAAIGYSFKRSEMLDRALTHASAVPGHAVALSNERLEFLGDRVLGLVAASYVMTSEHDAEGVLAVRLNALVDRRACIEAANTADLAKVLIAGSSLRNQEAGFDSALADAAEAMVGAVYLDGGYGAAERVVHRLWKRALSNSSTVVHDPKTALQEWVQARGLPVPAYGTRDMSGPSHAPSFRVEVEVAALAARAYGQGTSKQKAEQAAAEALLKQLRKE